MTMNGIGVWHDAFDNRKASSMEYYDMRNTLIACAIHHPCLLYTSFRTRVKAGVTGFAQIYGKYNTVPYDKLKLDLFYIENYSCLLYTSRCV